MEAVLCSLPENCVGFKKVEFHLEMNGVPGQKMHRTIAVNFCTFLDLTGKCSVKTQKLSRLLSE